MNARGLKNIFLLVFLISIVVISYAELNNNLKSIKMEYIRKQTTESKSSGQDAEIKNIIVDQSKIDSDDTDKSADKKDMLLTQNYQGIDIGKWKPIERKDNFNNELQYYSFDNCI